MTIICVNCGEIEAIFARPTEKTPSFCIICKEDGMKRITYRQSICKYPGCPSQRSFGFIGGKIDFCALHKEPGMVNLKHSKCKREGCKLRPCYEDDTGIKVCAIHHIQDMKCVNIKLAQKQMGKYF